MLSSLATFGKSRLISNYFSKIGNIEAFGKAFPEILQTAVSKQLRLSIHHCLTLPLTPCDEKF